MNLNNDFLNTRKSNKTKQKMMYLYIMLSVFMISNCSIFSIRAEDLKIVKTIMVIPELEDPIKKTITQPDGISIGGHFSTVQQKGFSASLKLGASVGLSLSLSTNHNTFSPKFITKIKQKGVEIDENIVRKNALVFDIADVMSSVFIDTNFKVIDKRKLQEVVKSKKKGLDFTGSLIADSLELAKLVPVDAVLYVKVRKLESYYDTITVYKEDRIGNPSFSISNKKRYEGETRKMRVPIHLMNYSVQLVSTKTGSIILSPKLSYMMSQPDFEDEGKNLKDSFEEYKNSHLSGIAFLLKRQIDKIFEESY